MKFIYFLGVFYIFGCGASGNMVRNAESGPPKREECLELIQNGEWKQTLECLSNVPDSSRDQAYFDLKGSALMHLGQYRDAHTTFKQAIDKDVNRDNPFLYFKYGESLWKDHQFLESGKAMDEFLRIVSNPNPTIKQQANYHIRSAETADSLYRNPRAFNPIPLSDSINTLEDELGISLTYDRRQLILTRRATQEDLYHSQFRNGNWLKATPVHALNTPDNEGAAAISGDGSFLVFTACQNPSGIGSCDLFYSARHDTGWTKPALMPVVNSRYWESQPTLSSDGKAIIFSSNRPGGQGGRDLWLSVHNDKGWMQPLNLGPEINSSGNEANPFLHTDEFTLYFTSDYWPGFGGRDLFRSIRIRGNEWSKAENLGYPVNSMENEEGVFIESSGQKGYFSSAREGQFDLYTFEVDSAIQPQPSLLYEMFVADSLTSKPLEHATIKVYDWTNNRLVRTATTDEEGYAAFIIKGGREYGITISLEKYHFSSNRDHITENLTKDVTDTSYLAPVSDQKTIVLKNVHFASGEARLLEASGVELDQLARYLQDNPGLKIVLTGHTDNVGGKEDNLKLSKARSEAVKSYLVNQSVEEDRIKARGMGESQPIASNETPEGRQENRRTEITIIQ